MIKSIVEMNDECIIEREGIMELFLDCLPCMHRQALEAAYESTDDLQVQAKIMDDVIQVIADYRRFSCAPKLCRAVHRVVKEHTGNEDPYRGIKDFDIKAAQTLVKRIEAFIEKAKAPLEASLKAAATGNVMDTAIFKDLDIEKCLDEELAKAFYRCDIEDFKKDLEEGKTILIIGDNAGEGVFDKILIEKLSKKYNVTFAYRSEPIINDLTKREVELIGIDDYADTISTGCSAPGALVEEFTPSFNKVFYQSDVVISKGQGNFEALSDINRKVYFLLKAKCPKIAKALDVPLGDYVFKHNN